MLIEPLNYKTKFEQILKKYKEFALLPHYNPDPDALGSAYGLYYLLNKVFEKKAQIFFSGIIGRAENNKMIDLLDIPVIELKVGEPLPDIPTILLDTQPGTGNSPIVNSKNLKMVFDHHPIVEKGRSVRYSDIRTALGSTSTLIYSYFKDYNLKPSVNVATALFYGIQTDVVGEGRTAYKIDFEYMEELGKFVNQEKLYAIENPKLPFDYYIHINKGMENSVIYNDFLITSLGEIENPDYIGEIADFLVRYDKCYFVLVMGVHQGNIQLSFRSQRKKVNAGFVLKQIVGRMGYAGGHSSSAGGRITMSNTEEIPKLTKKIITRALNIIHEGKITSGVPFLSLGDYLNY